MAKSRLLSTMRAALCVLVMAVAAVAALAMPQRKATPPKTLRLYVFDCGVIEGIDVGLFNFKKEELAETRMAVPCHQVARNSHPSFSELFFFEIEQPNVDPLDHATIENVQPQGLGRRSLTLRHRQSCNSGDCHHKHAQSSPHCGKQSRLCHGALLCERVPSRLSST